MSATPSMPPAWGQPPFPQPPAVRKPSRGKAWLTHGATALIALVIGAAIGGNGDAGGTTAAGATPAVVVSATAAASAPATTATVAATPTKAVTAKPKPTKKAGPAASLKGDGEYLVGSDIQPGTYRTAGPDEDSIIPNCYWARLKDASGELGAIIANDNAQGQVRVTVNKGEYFKTSGCQTWEKVG